MACRRAWRDTAQACLPGQNPCSSRNCRRYVASVVIAVGRSAATAPVTARKRGCSPSVSMATAILRRQFGCSSTVPGRFACSTVPKRIVELDGEQPAWRRGPGSDGSRRARRPASRSESACAALGASACALDEGVEEKLSVAHALLPLHHGLSSPWRGPSSRANRCRCRPTSLSGSADRGSRRRPGPRAGTHAAASRRRPAR